MSDNRKEARQRTFLKGRIIFNNGASSMDCLVRDMSATGARLALTETATLPEMFDLFIPQKERTYKANLRWRRADGIGVAFADETTAATPVPPPQDDPAAMLALIRRIAELEAENAALRRLIAATPAPASVA
ncbi:MULTISPECIES: PilZ domain-containing protein [unclassified Methylobacterium]|uniref:PilZ domain-containing protein n=1 Tax=unclassified Methylobacterium TaxID=2615210 RepID=UPI0006FF5AD7|nr:MULTISPECIES: PilZ domain-containing protein [unclassified Methylobacterium]KQO56992.1 pilus assembly protein PilZ [Methylobacterium sp. Leaf86]KQO93626.1 pilus assembly protein PilZ [Methylobacterium sp. Leaf91]